MGGIPTLCHKKICDATATPPTKICHHVSTESLFQPLINESFDYHSANTESNTRLDIDSLHFYNPGQDAFLC